LRYEILQTEWKRVADKVWNVSRNM
jgi:hypothetical protein